MFFPIMKIIREEARGVSYEYRSNRNSTSIEIYLNDDRLLCLPVDVFDAEATRLLSDINAGSGAFEVARTEAFIRSIYMTKLKAPTTDKSDINIQIHDVNTGYQNVVGFSIKSELGSAPTLLNAGRTTNFIYNVTGLDSKYIDKINSINTSTKIIDRMKAIKNNGGQFLFEKMENETFRNNLIMIDSQMPSIIAEMLIGYYSGVSSNCSELADYVSHINPLQCSTDFYRHKIKDLLCAIALGMKPATAWDGTDEASGGYIVVKTNGDVLAYHIYNRDAFRKYLLKNTKLERGSTSRHGFGVLYRKSEIIKIKMNLQIRFI